MRYALVSNPHCAASMSFDVSLSGLRLQIPGLSPKAHGKRDAPSPAPTQTPHASVNVRDNAVIEVSSKSDKIFGIHASKTAKEPTASAAHQLLLVHNVWCKFAIFACALFYVLLRAFSDSSDTCLDAVSQDNDNSVFRSALCSEACRALTFNLVCFVTLPLWESHPKSETIMMSLHLATSVSICLTPFVLSKHRCSYLIVCTLLALNVREWFKNRSKHTFQHAILQGFGMFTALVCVLCSHTIIASHSAWIMDIVSCSVLCIMLVGNQ